MSEIGSPEWFAKFQATSKVRKRERLTRSWRGGFFSIGIPLILIILQAFIPNTTPATLIILAFIRIGAVLLFSQLVWIVTRAENGLTDLDVTEDRYGLTSREMKQAVRRFFLNNNFNLGFYIAHWCLGIVVLGTCLYTLLWSTDVFEDVMAFLLIFSFFTWIASGRRVMARINSTTSTHLFRDIHGYVWEAMTARTPELPPLLEVNDPRLTRWVKPYCAFAKCVSTEFSELLSLDWISRDRCYSMVRNIGGKMQASAPANIRGIKDVPGSRFYQTLATRSFQILFFGAIVAAAGYSLVNELGGNPLSAYVIIVCLVLGWWFHLLARRDLNLRRRAYPVTSFMILAEGKRELAHLSAVAHQAEQDAQILGTKNTFWAVPYAALIWVLESFTRFLNNPDYVKEISIEDQETLPLERGETLLETLEPAQNPKLAWDYILQSLYDICTNAAEKSPTRAEFIYTRDHYFQAGELFASYPTSERIFKDCMGISTYQRILKLLVGITVICGTAFFVLFFVPTEGLEFSFIDGEINISGPLSGVFLGVGLGLAFGMVLLFSLPILRAFRNLGKVSLSSKIMFGWGSNRIYDAIMTERLKKSHPFKNLVQRIIQLEVSQWKSVFGSLLTYTINWGDLNEFEDVNFFKPEIGKRNVSPFQERYANFFPSIIPGFQMRFKSGEVIRNKTETIIVGGCQDASQWRQSINTSLCSEPICGNINLTFPQENVFKLDISMRLIFAESFLSILTQLKVDNPAWKNYVDG